MVIGDHPLLERINTDLPGNGSFGWASSVIAQTVDKFVVNSLLSLHCITYCINLSAIWLSDHRKTYFAVAKKGVACLVALSETERWFIARSWCWELVKLVW